MCLCSRLPITIRSACRQGSSATDALRTATPHKSVSLEIEAHARERLARFSSLFASAVVDVLRGAHGPN
jgi:hypothetical protein